MHDDYSLASPARSSFALWLKRPCNDRVFTPGVLSIPNDYIIIKGAPSRLIAHFLEDSQTILRISSMKQCPRPFESCISEKRSATVTMFHCFRDYLLVRTTHPYVIMGRRAPGSQSMVPCTVVIALSEWAVEALMGSTNLGSALLSGSSPQE